LTEKDVSARRYEVTEVPLKLSRFASLPAGAIKRSVYSVYDGDTITLRGKDNAKVRLLAMDTPEVQDHEPYALEARDFVAKLLLKKDVYLVFEGQEKDRYGRYLAYIYVKDKSVTPFKYINVNIAAVEVGLANYYHPQTNPLVLDSVFIDSQKFARKQKLHLWKDVVEDVMVYRTAHGRAFHRKKCRSIEHVPLSSMLMSEALDEGYHPCRDCHPNWASKLPKVGPHSKSSTTTFAAVVPKPVSTNDTTAAENEEAPVAVAAATAPTEGAPAADAEEEDIIVENGNGGD
jgi:micrococcal nuclease